MNKKIQLKQNIFAFKSNIPLKVDKRQKKCLTTDKKGQNDKDLRIVHTFMKKLNETYSTPNGALKNNPLVAVDGKAKNFISLMKRNIRYIKEIIFNFNPINKNKEASQKIELSEDFFWSFKLRALTLINCGLPASLGFTGIKSLHIKNTNIEEDQLSSLIEDTLSSLEKVKLQKCSIVDSEMEKLKNLRIKPTLEKCTTIKIIKKEKATKEKMQEALRRTTIKTSAFKNAHFAPGSNVHIEGNTQSAVQINYINSNTTKTTKNTNIKSRTVHNYTPKKKKPKKYTRHIIHSNNTKRGLHFQPKNQDQYKSMKDRLNNLPEKLEMNMFDNIVVKKGEKHTYSNNKQVGMSIDLTKMNSN